MSKPPNKSRQVVTPSVFAGVRPNPAGILLKTATNPNSWPYPTHEARSWPTYWSTSWSTYCSKEEGLWPRRLYPGMVVGYYTKKGSVWPLPRGRFSAAVDPCRWVTGSGRQLPDGGQLLGGSDDGEVTSAKALTLLWWCRPRQADVWLRETGACGDVVPDALVIRTRVCQNNPYTYTDAENIATKPIPL